MTDARLGQLPVEVVLYNSSPAANIAQLPVEVVLYNSNPSVNLFQLPVEVIAVRNPDALLWQLPIEIIRQATASVAPTSSCSGVLISSVQALDFSTIQVNFTTGVVNNFSIQNPSFYTTSPVLPIYSVSVISTSSVNLATAGMVQGQSYDLELTTIEASASCPDISIASISQITPTKLRITFDFPAINNLALQTIGNYSITPTLSIWSIEIPSDPAPYVDLNISPPAPDVNYDIDIFIVEAAS